MLQKLSFIENNIFYMLHLQKKSFIENDIFYMLLLQKVVMYLQLYGTNYITGYKILLKNVNM